MPRILHPIMPPLPPSAYSDRAAQPPAAKLVISSKDSTSLFSGGGLRPNCLSRGLAFRNTFLCQVSVKCGSSMSDVALIEQHLVEAFKQTNVDYLKEEKGYHRDAGSTASTAVLVGDRIVVANVGDSSVVASSAGSG